MDYIEEESFSDLKLLLKLEEFYKRDREANIDVPSYCYEDYEKMLGADLFSALKKDSSRNLNNISLRPKNIPATNPLLEDVKNA